MALQLPLPVGGQVCTPLAFILDYTQTAVLQPPALTHIQEAFREKDDCVQMFFFVHVSINVSLMLI